jgi:hypothetical protein
LPLSHLPSRSRGPNIFVRNVVEEFALHAKRDARVGERVSLPDAIFQQVSSTAVKSAISRNETHRRALDAYRLPPSPKGEQVFAILGRGSCYCNVEANCKMWVFTFKDGKFDKALEIQDAQTFGYVSSKSAFPLLIVWTRLEPTEFGARVFHFYAGKYDEAGAWWNVTNMLTLVPIPMNPTSTNFPKSSRAFRPASQSRTERNKRQHSSHQPVGSAGSLSAQVNSHSIEVRISFPPHSTALQHPPSSAETSY